MNVLVVGHDEIATVVGREFDDSAPHDIVWLWCDPTRELIEAHPGAMWVISTPLPVGTCAALEEQYPDKTFVVVPENVRAAYAGKDFESQDRIIVGAREHDDRIVALLAPFTKRVLWMSPESAEMVKHALNGFLAVQVAYGNEIGRLCELVGADANDVVRGLRSDARIGDNAYLVPGSPPGPHLQREVARLLDIGAGPLVAAAR